MVMNLIVIAVIALLAYIWGSRGMFSALLHLACTIVAGAIAFAAWEPLTYGLLLGLHEDTAWAVGLVAPFVVSLLVLRLIVDKLVAANMQFPDAANFIGGLVFGAGSGLITAGILVIAIGFLRVPPDFMGYRPVAYSDDARGSFVKGSALWVPADRIVAGLYELTSAGALATSTPLAEYQPAVYLQAGLVRNRFEGSRIAMQPEDFQILGTYTVEAEDTSALLSDNRNAAPQRVQLLEGEMPPPGSRLLGVLIQFDAGARESAGQIVIGQGQVRLIADGPEGAKNLPPVAVISRGDAATPGFTRWRYDTELHIASVGGANQAVMGFEFVVPPGYTPRNILVRNVRAPLAGRRSLETALAPSERDAALRDFSLFTNLEIAVGSRIENLETTEHTQVIDATPGRDTSVSAIMVTENLRGAANRSYLTALTLESGTNRIQDGETTITAEQFNARGLDNNLRVDNFAWTDDTRVVQIDVSPNSSLSLLGRAFAAAEGVAQPVLVDSLGQAYQPIGYVFEDGANVTIRFTPGRPLRALSEAPNLSQSRPNQKLRLIFRVSSGVEIEQFVLGNRVVAEFEPPLPVPQRRASR